MAEATKMSGGQFLAALKQQGPISALLSAAKSIDVSELSEDESKDIARGLKDFAGTKNGPMLIMGLPGPLQALLSFCGTTMPGLDRLGYLKASPRQALNRLLRTTDERLLKQYRFDKLTKTDWSYYLENCKTAFIAPFAKFLRRPESAGGFSDKEIGAAVLANRELVKLVPIERIDPDSAAELMVSGTSQLLWQKYDFNRFKKQHWWKVLESGGVADLPKPCERFLANEDGKGFSTTELIELARCCDLVEQWIDPDEVAFSDVYDLYVTGKGKLLWRRFPFSGLNRSEWEVILKNREIDIPSAFVEAVNFGMFTVDDLCAFAVKNPKVFPFVGIDSISPRRIVDLLLQCDAQYLWDHYPFARLKAEDWQHLICNYAKNGVVPHAEMLGDSEGMSTDISAKVLAKNDAYLKFIPFDFVEPRLAVELMATGRHEKLWEQYDFTRLQKDDWQRLFAKSDRVPVQFSGAVGRELFSVPELCALAKKNVAFVDFIPLEKLSPGAFIDLFLETRSKKLWNAYDFSRLTGPNWKRLICSLKTKGIVSAAKHIKTAAGLTTEIVSSLLDVNPGYYKYVPVELIATDDVIKVLLSGECEELWDEFPFERFSKSDWVLFFTKTTRIPPAFDAVVKREVFTLGELCDYARHNEAMVAYLPVALLNNETLTELLILSKTEVLWTVGNLRRLDAECWVKLIGGRKSKLLTKQKLLSALREVKGFSAEHVKKILAVDDRYYEYLPPELLPHCWVVEHLISGKPEGLWESYPFSLFDDEDWFGLLENTTHAVPDAGMVFLANEYGKVDVVRLNALLSKRRDLVGYLNPKDIEPNLAISFLVKKSGSDLWGKYDFRLFSDKQLQTIVAKAPERESWPKEISDKFSSAKGSFSDNEILTLAEKSIVNVLELLSAKRVHQSGVSFFEKICDFAKTSKPAISLITRKLTIGTKPWSELEREYQIALLVAIPLCRKFIDWQSFELKFLDKLLTADKAFKSELRGGRKFKLFVWRHWLFLMIVVIIAACLSYRAVCDLCEQAHLRMVAARQDFVVRQINALEERGDYESLDRYLGTVSQGEDAHLLEDARTARARAGLNSWKRKRESATSRIGTLRQIARDGWSAEALESAKECFAILQNNNAVSPNERNDIDGFRRSYDSRRAEIARQKKNEVFAKQIVEIERRCCKSDTIETAQSIVSELEPIFSDSDIDDENTERCSKANVAMYAHIEALFKRELSRIQKKIDKSESISEIDQIAASAQTLSSCGYVGDHVRADCMALVGRISKRKTALREAAEKAQVEVLHKEVVRLQDELESSDETSFSSVSATYSQLKNKDGFGRYSKAHADEYAALGAAIQKRNDGVARADAVVAAATACMRSFDGKIVSDADLEAMSRQLQALELWKTEFSVLVEWKKDAIERCREQVSGVCDGMRERIALVSAINKATDYGVLYDSIQRLLKKYSSCAECRQIDASRIMSESQVKSAITKSGWFSSEVFCEFIGVIKVCPKNASDVVPMINKSVEANAEIFCVGMHYDTDSQKWLPSVKKIFERTRKGGFRKVSGISYDKCQGIGLFISKDPSYVDVDSWEPGSRNPEHEHWFASRKPGVWIVEPGYEKTSVFAGDLSEVRWAPNKTYDRKYRTDRVEGCWQCLGDCHACLGSGTQTYEYLSWTCPRCKGTGKIEVRSNFGNWYNPARCTACKGNPRRKSTGRRQCSSCRGKGTAWYDLTPADAKELVQRLIAEA